MNRLMEGRTLAEVVLSTSISSGLGKKNYRVFCFPNASQSI